jgi:hypothetical protein
MTRQSDKIAAAYEECLLGMVRQRAAGERAAAERARETQISRVSERAVERREARFFAATGRDPCLAAAVLHKRLNRERRQEKAADIEDALESIDAIIAGKDIPTPPAIVAVCDRWCANCKAHRVDDPCEVCARHTLSERR